MEEREQKVTTIGRHPFERALLLQNLLQAEGIDCFLAHENLIQPDISGGVELKVGAPDIEKAMKIIESAFPTPTPVSHTRKALSFKRILVPVDFSEQSLAACKLAIGLARGLKAEIRLLHVYYNPVIEATPFDLSYSYQLNLSKYLHQIETEARTNLDKLVHDLKKYLAAEEITGVKLGSALMNGIAADEILYYSHTFKPEIIVMGTKGIGHNISGSIGSVTASIIEKSDFTVCAIPPKSKLSGVSDLKSILFATDFDPSDVLAIEKLIHLVGPLGVKIYCYHISLGIKKPWEKVKLDSLKEHFGTEYPLADIDFGIVLSDSLMNGLESFLRNKPVDAIALTTHKRGFFANFFAPSITRRIFMDIPRPLLVFRTF
jgi:nucleotide-binding universal stress UspA family protein